MTFLAEDRILLGLRVSDKAGALREIARPAAAALEIEHAGLVAALEAREALGSTGVGAGVALPHARSPAVARPFLSLTRLSRAIEFGAIDGKPVDLLALVVSGADDEEHLRLLASISRDLRRREIAVALRAAGGPRDAMRAFEPGAG